MQNTSFKRFKLRYFVLAFIVLSIISGIFGAVTMDTQYGSDIAALILGGSLTLYMLYQWKSHKISFNEQTIQETMTNKRWAKYIGFSFVIKIVGILALMFVGALILYFFKDSLEWILDLLSDVEFVEMTPLGYIYFFISICIFAPLWEELFFRGILLRRFMMKWKVSTSIVVSSLIFGLLHFGGSSMLHAAIFGGFMAYAYLKTKNIVVPIVLHAVSNFFSFILLFLPSSEEEFIAVPTESELQVTLWLSAVFVVISMGIFIFIIARNWHKIRAIPTIKEPVEVEPEVVTSHEGEVSIQEDLETIKNEELHDSIEKVEDVNESINEERKE